MRPYSFIFQQVSVELLLFTRCWAIAVNKIKFQLLGSLFSIEEDRIYKMNMSDGDKSLGKVNRGIE